MSAANAMSGTALYLRSLCRNCLNLNHVSKRMLSSTSNIQVEKENQYDIIIAGGGMVGCTLACALAKNTKLSSQGILLLEGSPEQKFTLKEQYSNRVTALNHNTKNLMTSIGAWQHIQQMRCQPVKNMQVWDASSDAMITFNHHNLQGDVAYIVENDILLHAVNTEISSPDIPNKVNVIHSAKIADYELPVGEGEKAVVQMEDGRLYSCKLLIGADGANSKVRQKMDVKYISWQYNQMGVVATVELAEETQNTTAWQRFLPSGPVALLPLGPRHSSLVWTTSSQEAKRLLQLPPEEFLDSLTHALHKDFKRSRLVDSMLGALVSAVGGAGLRQLPPPLSSVQQRAAFPLAFGHASRYVGQGVALIGDAAHRVHPLAGQGVNLGFGDVSDLVEILANAVYSGSPIGEKTQLLDYETRRQRHVFPTAVAIDGLQKLYSYNNTPVILLRSLGLQLTHSLTPLKRAIMNHAMG